MKEYVDFDSLNEIITSLQERVEEVEDKMTSVKNYYPVGSIYINVNNINPRTMLGFGTWEQIKDKFLLASGSTYTSGTTGGEATHTLTVAEMPNHTHTVGREILENPNNQEIGQNYGVAFLLSQNPLNLQQGIGGGNTKPFTYANNDKLYHSHSLSSIGNSQEHNNMPPYLVVNIWQRIN